MATATAQAIGEQRLTGGQFYGSVLGKATVGGAIFTDLHHTSARKLPAHSHELPFFCLFFGGDYEEKYGRRDVQFRPFTLSFRPPGVPHQDAIGPSGARMFGIEVKPDWQRNMQSCSGSLEVGYDFEGGGPLWLALKLYFETRQKLPDDDIRIESLVCELVGAVACKPESCRAAPPWLKRVQEKLHAEFHSRITLDDLALEGGVHPVHLSRVFRRCVGKGIGDYVHRLRVRQACERMLDPEVSLADLSVELGFADQSHFSRAFRSITGNPPAAFRATLSRHALTSRASQSLRPFLSSAGLRP